MKNKPSKAYLVNRAHEVLKYTKSAICYSCGNLVEDRHEGYCPGPCRDGGDVHSLLETYDKRKEWGIGLELKPYKEFQVNVDWKQESHVPGNPVM